MRTGEAYSIEHRIRAANGVYRWFLGQAMPQRNSAGDIVRWVGTLTDISDQKAVRAGASRERTQRDRQQHSATRLDGGLHWLDLLVQRALVRVHRSRSRRPTAT